MNKKDICYACGCKNFEENWEWDGINSYQEIICTNCGRLQGQQYEQEYLKRKDYKK